MNISEEKYEFIKDDGFDNLEDDLQKTTELGQYDLELHNQKKKEKRFVRVIKSNLQTELPPQQSFTYLIQQFLLKQGISLGQQVSEQIQKIPSYLLNTIKITYQQYQQDQQNKQKEKEKEKEIEEQKEQINEQVILVMPEKIINADILTQQKWIDENKSSIVELFAPVQKDYRLKELNQSIETLESIKLDDSKYQREQFDDFNCVENLDDYDTEFLVMSNYESSIHLKEQKHYPYLVTFIDKDYTDKVDKVDNVVQNEEINNDQKINNTREEQLNDLTQTQEVLLD